MWSSPKPGFRLRPMDSLCEGSELPFWRRVAMNMLVWNNRSEILIRFFSNNVAVVIFLAILANEAVALPLPTSFPTVELQYLLENSDPKVVLGTPQFESKAQESLRTAREHKPKLCILDKLHHPSTSDESVEIVDAPTNQGGLMLYTSGTTSRPVRSLWPPSVVKRMDADLSIERCCPHRSRHYGPG
jgi:acyl-CoA synthetase (AMP-forming)/AMP-acid ligase II